MAFGIDLLLAKNALLYEKFCLCMWLVSDEQEYFILFYVTLLLDTKMNNLRQCTTGTFIFHNFCKTKDFNLGRNYKWRHHQVFYSLVVISTKIVSL